MICGRCRTRTLKQFAIAEVGKIGILDPARRYRWAPGAGGQGLSGVLWHLRPFEELRAFTDRFENLFLVGRNGMHKYNNQDHSMLTAMHAVDGIISGNVDKRALWEINAEQEYHERKSKR